MLFTEQDIEYIKNNEFYPEVKPYLRELYRLKAMSQQEGDATFPKKCSRCGEVYLSTETFIERTIGIQGGDHEVCYTIGDQTRIFRYRNCPPPCNSTLVVAREDRRDQSEAGLRRREIFGMLHVRLREVLTDVSGGACHSIALFLVRSISYENVSPLEAYHFFINDVASGRFVGFAEEPEIKVESLAGQRAS